MASDHIQNDATNLGGENSTNEDNELRRQMLEIIIMTMERKRSTKIQLLILAMSIEVEF